MSPTPAPVIQPSVHGPYEDLAIKALEVIEKILDSQPKDVQVQLWQGYLDDVKAWRAFWQGFRNALGDAFKDSAK